MFCIILCSSNPTEMFTNMYHSNEFIGRLVAPSHAVLLMLKSSYWWNRSRNSCKCSLFGHFSSQRDAVRQELSQIKEKRGRINFYNMEEREGKEWRLQTVGTNVLGAAFRYPSLFIAFIWKCNSENNFISWVAFTYISDYLIYMKLEDVSLTLFLIKINLQKVE